MAGPAPLPSPVEGARDHHVHRVRIARVVEETAEAASFVLDVPHDLAEGFAYDAGQFCTFRVHVDDQPLLRCYSMSSTPGVDDELQVTVKRVPDGKVSNWMLDTLQPGDEIEATYPAGVFRLGPGSGDLVLFAGGSGITPVFSLIKQALTTTSRKVHLLYANKDPASTIFLAELHALAAEHAERLEVVHHHDVDAGFVTGDTVSPFAWKGDDPDFYLCGPTPFMDVVESTLLAEGIHPGRIFVERFGHTEAVEPGDPSDPLTPAAGSGGGPGTQVTIELGGRTETTAHHPGTTILQTARELDLPAPYSCEAGSCATCMARLVEGSVSMRVNNALTDEEVEEGWVLTCQSVPEGPLVHVVYEED